MQPFETHRSGSFPPLFVRQMRMTTSGTSRRPAAPVALQIVDFSEYFILELLQNLTRLCVGRQAQGMVDIGDQFKQRQELSLGQKSDLDIIFLFEQPDYRLGQDDVAERTQPDDQNLFLTRSRQS